MRSEFCLCLTLAVIGSGLCTASAQTATPAPPIAASANTPASAGQQDTASLKDDDQDDDDDAPVKGKGKKESVKVLLVLPEGTPQNPPKPEDLKTSGMTWKGEYEADKSGKPLLGPDGKPLAVLYDKKGKRVKSRIKVAKTHPINIVAGTLTVDGWTGKARLNYDIPDLKYIYISSPTVGTVIVAQAAFPGSVEQKDAFIGNTLTVKAGDHELQLTSDTPLLGKKPEPAWVKFDDSYTADQRYPVMGFGSKNAAPYEWPGAKVPQAKGSLDAPPLPTSMQPKLATPVCIAKAGKVCPSKPADVPSASLSANPSATSTN